MADPKDYTTELNRALAEAARLTPAAEKELKAAERDNTKVIEDWLKKDTPGLKADGIWTPETDKALEKRLSRYQKDNNLEQTGVLDYNTYMKMLQNSGESPKTADPPLDVVGALGDLQKLDIHKQNKAEAEGKPYEGKPSLQKPPLQEPSEAPAPKTPEPAIGSTMSLPPEGKTGSTLSAPKEERTFASSLAPEGGIKLGEDKYGNPTVQPGKAFWVAANALPDQTPAPAPSPRQPELDLPPGP